MSGRIYPYTAWLLTRTFAVVKVELVGTTGSGQHERTAKGKWYLPDCLFASREQAIEHGRLRIEAARAEIARRQAALDDNIAMLNKAQGYGAFYEELLV
ncbi:hypothetical protein M2401_005888 [Pseudomonas sp. JUb42]|jgi:hypothetical protein|uniref:hypothetical protein n=1 Tax=Pseudomonas sp. JUb42 TaxID=2940611 RepID=UPI002167624D|nr:hypothetical protein [Pseudomonas sp. JUb42]MCS3472124.1 hypothetical protein [Pseudomonas sp. JUb42]